MSLSPCIMWFVFSATIIYRYTPAVKWITAFLYKYTNYTLLIHNLCIFLQLHIMGNSWIAPVGRGALTPPNINNQFFLLCITLHHNYFPNILWYNFQIYLIPLCNITNKIVKFLLIFVCKNCALYIDFDFLYDIINLV